MGLERVGDGPFFSVGGRYVGFGDWVSFWFLDLFILGFSRSLVVCWIIMVGVPC